MNPSPRSEFAHTRSGEILIIFGGNTDTITTSDMYTLNLRTKQWKYVEPKSESNPTPRSGSCMGYAGGFIFIFGGKSNSQYTNELWMYDPGSNSYILLDTTGEQPPVSSNGNCNAYLDPEKGIIFETYMGETRSGMALSTVYRYYHNNKKWERVLNTGSYQPYARSLTSAILMGDQLLIAGGSEWEYVAHNEVYIVNTATSIPTLATYLPDFTFNAASLYYKNKLYIHGGSASFGTLPMQKIPRNNLIAIELDDSCSNLSYICRDNCSKGTYSTGSECATCPIGSYNENIGSFECKLCPAGYYSDTKGADSERFCKPCDYGFYNTEPGQSRCYICPYDYECSYSQGKPKIDINPQSLLSSQPDLLPNNQKITELYSNYVNMGLSLFIGTIILLISSFVKTRRLVAKLDLYKLHHNYELNKQMIIRKTLIGGISTIIFIGIAISIVFRTSLSIAIDNILETKALVPLVALERDYDSVIYK